MKDPTGRPCRECPFRRASAPGYLGADTPSGFMATTMADHEMPCHLTVDYEAPDWEERLGEATYCSGALIFFANIAKRSRDVLRPTLPPDREKVFARPHEFIEHHTIGVAKLPRRRPAKLPQRRK